MNTRQNERHRGYASIEANYFDDSERMDNRGYARMTSELLESHSQYNPEGTKTMFTVFLIVNSTLGSGLLNFPKSFDDAGGIIAASVVQIILLVFVMISLLALAYASDQCGTPGAENIQVSSYECYLYSHSELYEFNVITSRVR